MSVWVIAIELLRDVGVSKEISDFYTGHSSGDVARNSYGGIGVDTRYIEISKARHPWLKYKSKQINYTL